MTLDKIHSVYFIGIGGIGMSALARWFNINGYVVGGYDKTETSLTMKLVEEGMQVHFEDNIEKISDSFRNPDNTLVVYTPAIPKEHSELNYFKSQNFKIQKRAEVLGFITEKMFTIAVAGTHGKTTTSSMVAHTLKASGVDCAAFLGGITQNYNTNLLLNEKKAEESVVVVEADEYDRSFLKLSPDIAVITSMDSDHLDIYGDGKEFQKTFNDFVKKIKPGGHLFYRDLVEKELDQNSSVSKSSFGSPNGELKAENIRIQNGEFIFDAVSSKVRIENINLIVPGFHNIENALAAISVALQLGIEKNKIKEAISGFKGVKRRFEYIVRKPDIIYIDDYAHHPTELEAFLKSVKALYADKKLTVVFQPHLFTRTRDFMDGFVSSLCLADKLILMEIYPARELPIPGITSQVLLDKIPLKEKVLSSKQELLDKIKSLNTDILVTVGAGDIDQFVEPIKKILEEK